MPIVVENLQKHYGEKEVLKGLSFRVEDKEKIGLVGSNGEGKTTLIRCLLGLESYSGRVSSGQGLKIGYAAQNAKIGEGSLWEELCAARSDISSLAARLAALSEQAATLTGDELEKNLALYSTLEEAYRRLGGYDYGYTVRRVAFALGFGEEDFPRRLADFSGGQKTRAVLAAALLGQPDFLFLDEPTNHLDMAMTEWLENYLLSFGGGLLIVSHDRYFLDRVTQKTLWLAGGHLSVYRGGYSLAAQKRAAEDKAKDAAYQKQAEHIAKTEEYIRRYKAGIKSKQARGRQSQLDRLARLEPVRREKTLSLHLPPPPPAADKVLTVEKLTIGYGGAPLLQNLNFMLRCGEKAALLGENGVGKTTLLRTLAGFLPPLAGRVTLGARVRPGYFSQEHRELFGAESVLAHFSAAYGFSEERLRTLLGGMLFSGDDVFKSMASLSGGERARAALLKILLDGANLLIMDEPTNHLDIASREAVEDALSDWPGSLLVVSHDRYFVQKIADRVMEIEGGKLTLYQGGYSHYLTQKAQKEESPAPPPPKESKDKENKEKKETKPEESSGGKATLRNERKIEAIELSLREEEALLSVLEKRLADPAAYENLVASEALAAEYAAQKDKVETLFAAWLELSGGARG